MSAARPRGSSRGNANGFSGSIRAVGSLRTTTLATSNLVQLDECCQSVRAEGVLHSGRLDDLPSSKSDGRGQDSHEEGGVNGAKLLAFIHG